MNECTCRQALPANEIGEIAVPNVKDHTLTVYKFDMRCPVHRVITAVNDVPLEPREKIKKTVDKPMTAREKRQAAFKKERAKPKA